MSGWAQTTAPAQPSDLRLSFDDNGGEFPRPGAKRPPRRPAPPVGVIPRFGNPPGSGAGKTGFNSTNVPLPRRLTPGRTGPDGKPAAKPPPLPPVPPPVTAARRTRPQQVAAAAPAAAPAATLAVPSGTGTPPPAAVVPPSDAVLLPPPVAVPPRLRPLAPDDDPFGPVGIRAGTFVLRPAVEVMTGYDTNPARLTVGAQGSPQLTVAPELLVSSDWERHQLDIAMRGYYNYYPDVLLGDRPYLDAKADGRIDVTRDIRIDVEGRYLLSTDYPGSPNITADIAKLPIYTDVGATLGVGERFNRFDVSVKGTFDRFDWQDSLLTNGTMSSNADRDYNQYGAQLRGSYEVLPGLKPFAELDADTRVHDLPIDRTGADRDSDGLAAKIGTTFEFTRTLTGSISVGYLSRLYVDPNLPNIDAPLLDASLVWAASGLTTVKFAAKTTVDESVLPDVSGVLRHDNGIEISHALQRWLITTVKFGYGIDDYIGSLRQDHRYVASLGMTYKLNRELWLKGELRQEWLASNIPLSNYAATIALIGLRVQR
ncbi:MAG TPA: outer membrane beta-barrel protein [Xanthobacteraceae bacterium]|nr:outer membrane beta-barrel protein [Xanthobacteraceae bacterium]